MNQTDKSTSPKVTPPANTPKAKWRPDQRGTQRYAILAVCVAAQCLTVLISWPAWQTRTDPPNLAIVEMASIPFDWLMLLSLGMVLIRPRWGIVAHCCVVFAACLADQYRFQPQILAPCYLMFACEWDWGIRVNRWLCCGLWFWSGLHKLLSTDWWGHASYWLINRISDVPETAQVPFLITVAVSEIALGICAFFRPKWAIVGCPILHFGILGFLSPIGIDWNYSVMPWNAIMAIAGCWIFWKLPSIEQSLTGEAWIATFILIMPIGFYFGWVNRGVANVLYSDTLPRGMVTKPTTHFEPKGWNELALPFPKERTTHLLYFRLVGEPGDKFHLAETRPFLDDAYYVMQENGVPLEITRQKFYSDSDNSVMGIGVDRHNSIHYLTRSGAALLRRDDSEPIYAIRFNPEKFRSEVLRHLEGLPNLEQIQLGGTDVSDEDLRFLSDLPRLSGIGLSNTNITDEGLKHLRNLRRLSVIEYEGTSISHEAVDAIIK